MRQQPTVICAAESARLHQDELGARRERLLGDDHPKHAEHAHLLQGKRRIVRFMWTPLARQHTTTAPSADEVHGQLAVSRAPADELHRPGRQRFRQGIL